MWTERSRWRAATMVVALVAVGACGRGDRPEYSKHEDSGAVAPAMRIDTSLTRDDFVSAVGPRLLRSTA